MDLNRSPKPNVGVRGILEPPDATACGNTGRQKPERAEGDRIDGVCVSAAGSSTVAFTSILSRSAVLLKGQAAGELTGVLAFTPRNAASEERSSRQGGF